MVQRHSVGYDPASVGCREGDCEVSPTYTYECEKCGHEFDRFQNMSDPRIKRCPECKGRVKRIVGAGAGIIFKGDGWCKPGR